MKRLFSCLLILFLITSATACANDNMESSENGPENKSSYKEVYIEAIEKVLGQIPPYSFKYLAIKMSTLDGTTQSERDEIRKYLQTKYKSKKIYDYAKIKNSLKYDYFYIRNGVVIEVEKFNEITDEMITFVVSTFVVPLASFGFRFNFEKVDAEWNMSNVKYEWIS